MLCLASLPINILLDFRDLEGITFQIIELKSIHDFNTFLGIVSGEKEDKEKKELTYL